MLKKRFFWRVMIFVSRRKPLAPLRLNKGKKEGLKLSPTSELFFDRPDPYGRYHVKALIKVIFLSKLVYVTCLYLNINLFVLQKLCSVLRLVCYNLNMPLSDIYASIS